MGKSSPRREGPPKRISGVAAPWLKLPLPPTVPYPLGPLPLSPRVSWDERDLGVWTKVTLEASPSLRPVVLLCLRPKNSCKTMILPDM